MYVVKYADSENNTKTYVATQKIKVGCHNNDTIKNNTMKTRPKSNNIKIKKYIEEEKKERRKFRLDQYLNK